MSFIKRFTGPLLDKLEDLRQGRFKRGLSVVGFAFSILKFPGRGIKVSLTLGQILSVNSGHWPFSVFDLCFITGERGCFHLTILGFMIGNIWKKDQVTDKDGGQTVNGPDYRELYFMFSCINHFNKQLEEIV